MTIFFSYLSIYIDFVFNCKALFQRCYTLIMVILLSFSAMNGIAQQPDQLLGNGFTLDKKAEQSDGGLGFSTIDSERTFLPVKQAYSVVTSFVGDDLLFDWTIAPKYYLYQKRTKFKHSDFNIETPVFSQAQLIWDEVFEKEMLIYRQQAQIRIANFATDNQASSMLTLEAQGCADAGYCYPPTEYWFNIDPINKTIEQLFDRPRAPLKEVRAGNAAQDDINIFGALLFAFLGGLILNLMPCVFPILAIKALNLSAVPQRFSHRAKEAFSYTLGVLLCTLSLAAVLILLRTGGAQIGWGFQLQSPLVVTALLVLFFIVGLGFSGMLNIGSSIAGVGQSLVKEGRPLQSFFTGVLAMVVASPCSAPFMGAAMGYAIGQSTAVALTVFAALGLGLALPIILLYMLPTLAKLLPRPGKWMNQLKGFLAIPIYATCVWLLWVLSAQIGLGGATFMLVSLLFIVVSLWAYKKPSGAFKALAFSSLVVVIAALSIAQSKAPEPKKVFVLSEFDALQQQSLPIFLDVTADWCVTCKFNEHSVLNTNEIQALFKQQNVNYVVADWTNPNPDISLLLERFGQIGIPLYVYYPNNGSEPIMLPQILTHAQIQSLFD